MAKSKKQKQVHHVLSPENYIRQKARNLPLYECLINKDWENHGTAEIIVARKHANDNITFGVYLTDMYCLGVKDSFCNFNQPVEEYEEMISKLSEEQEMIAVDYALAHNIIFAAIEYAGELGFKVCKEFNQTTKFILEEDTDDVELMEIECGHNGKPLFVKTDAFTVAQADGIIRQLEKAVGNGNYDVLIADGFDQGNNENEVDEYDNEYDNLDEDKRRDLFEEITRTGTDKLSFGDHKKLMILSDSIYLNDICDMDEVDSLLEKWEPETEMDISDEEHTPESLGLSEVREISEEDMDAFNELLDNTEGNSQDTLYKIEELRNKWGNLPYLCYQELRAIDQNENDKEYTAKIDEYLALYPDYSLLKIEKFNSILLNRGKINDEDVAFETIFEGRTAITDSEMFQFQFVKFMVMVNQDALDVMQALYEMYDRLEINEKYVHQLKALIVISRINFLNNYFKQMKG